MHAATSVPEGQALPARSPSSRPQQPYEAKSNNSHGYAKSKSTPGSLCASKHQTPAKYKKPVPEWHVGLQHSQLRTPASLSSLELGTPFEVWKAKNSSERSISNATGNESAQCLWNRMSSPACPEGQRVISHDLLKTPEPPSPIKAPSQHSSLQWLRGHLDKGKNSTSQSGLKLSSAAVDGPAPLHTPAPSRGSSSRTSGIGLSSHSSTRWSKESSSTKKTVTPPFVRKFKEDPAFFKQRLPLSDSDDDDTNPGGQLLWAEPPKGSCPERYSSGNWPPKRSPPKSSFLQSVGSERSGSKVLRTSGASGTVLKQQLQQSSSKRTCTPAKPLPAAHAQQSGRQRFPSYCLPKPLAAPGKEPAIPENAVTPEQAVAADGKRVRALAEGHSGALCSWQLNFGQGLSGSQKSLLSLLYEPGLPEGNYHTEINGRMYQMLDIIGKGGSSKVFMMFTHRKKLCAVKLVNMVDVQVKIVETFMNEVAILKSLRDCERVVRLYDYEYVKKDKILALVMEKGDQDLAAVLTSAAKKGSLSPVTIKFYWSEMLQSVQEIHKKGVIHSDLKPANFLFADGKLKLIDFGIASTMQADVTSVIKECPMGTLNFMSPESLQMVAHEAGKHCLKISRKSDVWSLGCILYHLVYGKTPFQHIRSTESKLAAIASESHAIEFPEISDPNLLDVLKKCLRRNPNHRPTISELLEHPYLTKDGAKQRNPVLESVVTEIENLSPASILKVSKMVKYLRGHKK